MIVIILIIIAVIVVYKFGKNSGEAIGRVSQDGGMRLKYAKLLKNILAGHRDSKIVAETRTYIRAGVSNYGGTTMFHIQQCPGNKVMIDYDVSDNPVVPSFSLRFTFPDDMDQDEMMEEIGRGIQRKMESLGGSKPETIKETTYWKKYLREHPQKAKDIQTIWGVDMIRLPDKDVREKIETVNKLMNRFKCEASQIKEKFLDSIDKCPKELLPDMIESTTREMSVEAETFGLSANNTTCSLFVMWLKEKNNSVSKQGGEASASNINEALKAARVYFPDIDEIDLKERAKSLREMSLFLKCPLLELKDYYLKDVYSKYDGALEHFHYLNEATTHMAGKALELASSTGRKSENTSYGIMCDWMFDVIEKERQKFIASKQVKCPCCHGTEITKGYWIYQFKCIKCNMDFQ